MKLRNAADNVLTDPKWKALWFFTNSLWAGITLYLLASYGYVFWDPILALLVGFFAPLVVYGTKGAMGLYKYRLRLGEFWYMDYQYKEAMRFYNNQDWELAANHFERVLEVGPDHKRALYYAAKCKENLEEWSDVVTLSRRYLKQNPEDEEAAFMLKRANQYIWLEE
ncbi:MAG: hypothetical protein ACFFAY_13165 [Promethearchaeota archaeon]